MAVIKISKSDDNLWFGAKWVFNIIIEYMRRNNTSDIMNDKINIASNDKLGFLDLCDISCSEKENIHRIIIDLITDSKKHIDNYVYDKSFQEGFLERLTDLERKLSYPSVQ